MIIAAAAIVDGQIRALPAPARHHHVLQRFPLPDHAHGDQGFIDDQRGFVGRELAAEIALAEGQIEKLKWPPSRFSEDLW